MTLNAGTTRIRYTSSGAAAYAFDFPIWAKTDLKVYTAENLRVVDTEYTVTFTAGSESGGTVTFLTAPASGVEVEIVRRLTFERDADFATSGAFSMETLNEQIDKVTAFAQDLSDYVDRTSYLPAETSGGTSAALPAPEALKWPRWNSGANAWENIDTDDVETTVQASAWVRDTFVDGATWTSGVTTEFTLSTVPGPEKNTQIYLDGVYQSKTLYSLSGAIVTFAVAPTGTTLECMVITAAESQSISTANSIQFNLVAGISVDEGELAWNPTANTLDLGLPGGVVMQIGQEIPLYVKNESGSLVNDGDMVYVSGSTGVHLVVGLADATDLAKSSQIGMVTTAGGIANNGFGFVTRFGAVRGIDTTGTPVGEVWAEGNLLYLSTTPGELSINAPGTPDYTVAVGIVINKNASAGVIGVDPKQPHSANVALGTSDLVGPTQGAVNAFVIKPGALVYPSAAQTLTNSGQLYALAFDTEEYDTKDIHDNATNNSRLTVPAGVTKVRLVGNVSFVANVTGQRRAVIRKGGVTNVVGTGEVSILAASASAPTVINIASAYLVVTAGQYFELVVEQLSTGSLDTDPDQTWFAMEVNG